ncbi:MAG: putative efflux protein family [Fibrobacteres bacterium]|nr:putative efflux protein family [Fibrobacterota bacterium]
MFLNIMDGIYVSRLGMEESLAVLNYGFPFFYMIFAVFNGLTSGTTSVLARLLGAKEKEKAENAMSQIVWIGLAIFLAFLIIYPFILPAYLSAQKATALGASLTRSYLNTMFLGVPFLVMALLWGSGLRAEGNTRTLMTGMMVGTLVNIALAPFLIFSHFRFAGIEWSGLGLSVTGAGLASTGSNLLTVLVVLSIYLRKGTILKLRIWPDWKERSELKDAFSVGLPSILSQSLTGINIFIMTRLAADFGPAAKAAIGIGARLETLAVFPALSIMVAVLTLVGQNFGAKRYDRVAQSVRMGLTTAFFSLAALGLVVHFLRAPLLAKFHPDAATFPSAYHYLGLTTFAYGFAGVSIVSSGAFQGLGRGLPFLFLNTMRLLFIAAPLGWFLARTRGEYGLHYAPLIASGCSALIATTWILTTVSRLKAKQEPLVTTPVAAAAV